MVDIWFIYTWIIYDVPSHYGYFPIPWGPRFSIPSDALRKKGGGGEATSRGARRKPRGTGKTIGKPWENHGKMVVYWDLMGFTWIYPLVSSNMAMESPLFLADFPIETPISSGIPSATFDSRRVPSGILPLCYRKWP